MKCLCMSSQIFSALAMCLNAIVVLPDTIQKHTGTASAEISPLASTVMLVPEEIWADTIVYEQKSLRFRVEGIRKVKQAIHHWDKDFQSEIGVKASIGNVSVISQNSALVKWNVTWVPPTSLWLEGLGKVLDRNNIECIYVTYNHLAQKESTFSWNAVLKLLGDAIARKTLRIPLACIEGNTELTFTESINSKGEHQLVRISEDLSYAEDLRRGVLRNRKCAEDLRLFLETGRRLVNDSIEWDDTVATSFSWQSVPGSNPLDVDAVEEGPVAAVVFIGIAALSVLVFASVVAPEMVGQSLFVHPNYIVKPGDFF